MAPQLRDAFFHQDSFCNRHIGPNAEDTEAMLAALGLNRMETLIEQAVPASIRLGRRLAPPPALSEQEMLADLRCKAGKNQVLKSWLGLGYFGTVTPQVIQRNILENPGWYTQYTPYQPEISQGRLEALLNFQTMVCELTAMEAANASLLDEPTACAEAMNLAAALKNKDGSKAFFIDQNCYPQTIEVVCGRAKALGLSVVVGDARSFGFNTAVFGVLLQYPMSDGQIGDIEPIIARFKQNDAVIAVASDLLALTLLKPPGELGADIAVGSAQRFGVPLGYGGPHAGFFATSNEYKRLIPGRIVGVSKDIVGTVALRLTLQTREQHIRREKATSNICTAQALLATMAGMYAVYHGPEGLTGIAKRVHARAVALARAAQSLGYTPVHKHFFDTVCLETNGTDAEAIVQFGIKNGVNLRVNKQRKLIIACDETMTVADWQNVVMILAHGKGPQPEVERVLAGSADSAIDPQYQRASAFLQQPVFAKYRSETEMMRYLHRLEGRDLSLITAMIPLGSCTMKLNAACELAAVTWPEFGQIHPFAPVSQAEGYAELIAELQDAIKEMTGFAGVSLQPNSGAQGEYAGLLVIRAYHASKMQGHRNVCLIPSSAHGTNPASAAMAGLRVVVVNCDAEGNIDIADLRAKAEKNKEHLAALMVTYPSTHGVFENGITEVCQLIHSAGGQVYMDGANFNAQVGLCRPGDFGPDVCHLNLHKTFCIPHGGGGPGMGPIAVAAHLLPFLPGHCLREDAGAQHIPAVSGAPFGSAGLLPISWAYCKLMGEQGLKMATETAILNANYMAMRLAPHYPVLYRGSAGRVAHECIIDLRPLKAEAGVDVSDVAKRLMDYGFHAPTVSFPVPQTMMIEPTESEGKQELDRFCDAMIAIRAEIHKIANGHWPAENNPLKNAPHTLAHVAKSSWDHPYSREEAAFPAPDTRVQKFWPAVGRIDEAFGDRNFCCTL